MVIHLLNILPMSALHALDNPIMYNQLTDEEFEQLIIGQGIAAVVTITTHQMRGAAMMHAIMEGLAKEYQEQMNFFYLAPDSNKVIEKHGLYDTAAIFFFCNGEVKDHQIGLVAKNKLRAKIDQFIATVQGEYQ